MKIPSAYQPKPPPTQVVADASFVNTHMPTEGAGIEVSENPEILNQLDWQTWLPFAAKTYCISANPADYILKPMLLMPSDIPNRNGIGFPIGELVRFLPPPMNRQVYRSWVGTPIHIEHDNADCTKAIGVVIDTALRQIRGYGDDKHWKVMGLLAIDKTKDPVMAQKVLTGEINTGSMGALANAFTCAVCGKPATKNQFTNCAHITTTDHVNWQMVDHLGKKHLAYLNAHELGGIEYSLVQDPAWVAALSDENLNW